MKKRFTEEVQKAVFRSGWSVDEIAKLLDKRPSTLYNELNPMPLEHCLAKLGIEDAMKIMDLIDDHTPLAHLADEFGYSLIETARVPDAQNMREEVLQGYQATHELLRAVDEGRPCSELVPLCNNAQQELEDVVQRKKNDEQRLHAVK